MFLPSKLNAGDKVFPNLQKKIGGDAPAADLEAASLEELNQKITTLEHEKNKEEDYRNYMQLERVCAGNDQHAFLQLSSFMHKDREGCMVALVASSSCCLKQVAIDSDRCCMKCTFAVDLVRSAPSVCEYTCGAGQDQCILGDYKERARGQESRTAE
jgi:hypothetical protein